MSLLQNSNAISSGSYNINNSLRFRRSATAYLNRTPASAGNRKTFTYSAWIKRGLSGNNNFFNVNPNTGYSGFSLNFDLNVSGDIGVYQNVGGTNTLVVSTNALFRDFSAWYHVVVAIDTTQATAANRVLIYVNGVSQALTISTQVALNTDLYVNSTLPHFIGREQTASGGATNYFDGYMAEVNFIDGSQKAASDFGETDTTTGVWKPKAYTGTYGTNGFYLKFSDIATTSGSNAGLGKDFSGNSNYWTTNNISVTSGTTYDAMTDVPTNTSATAANYAVLNPLGYTAGTTATLSSGNLNFSGTGYGSKSATLSLPSSGKYYAEFQITSTPENGPAELIGIASSSNPDTINRAYASNGQYFNGTSFVTFGSAWSINDIIGVAMDVTNSQLSFYKNNILQGSTQTYAFTTDETTSIRSRNAGTSTFVANFGQRPFAYTPPTGFVALNTFNLPTPTILQGNTNFNILTWTGTGTSSGRSFTGVGFAPDLVWAKPRSVAYDHNLNDKVRGANKRLRSNTTDAENTNDTYGYLSSFDSDGWTTVSGATENSNWNQTSATYVAWCWKANGAGSSNTSGSITSTVSVNTTAGFSIVTYTGNGSASQSIGHGLGVAPKWIIVKARSNGVYSWGVYHVTQGNTKYALLNTTDAFATSAQIWASTTPTSSVFYVGSDLGTNKSGDTYVAYCWAEIAGFSKFGSYTGNGSTDGTFVYTGFRPEFIMFKRTNDVSDWNILDTTRSPYNTSITRLFANVSNAENSSAGNYDIDILSNGFKQRNTNSSTASNSNLNGSTYIFMAFAENPLKNSLAR